MLSAAAVCFCVRAGRQAKQTKKKQSARCARPAPAPLGRKSIRSPSRSPSQFQPHTPIGSGRYSTASPARRRHQRIDASAPAAQPEPHRRRPAAHRLCAPRRSSARRRRNPSCPSLDPLVRWAASSLKDSSCAHPKQPHTACASVQTSRAIWPRTCAPKASSSCALASCARQRRSQQGETTTRRTRGVRATSNDQLDCQMTNDRDRQQEKRRSVPHTATARLRFFFFLSSFLFRDLLLNFLSY